MVMELLSGSTIEESVSRVELTNSPTMQSQKSLKRILSARSPIKAPPTLSTHSLDPNTTQSPSIPQKPNELIALVRESAEKALSQMKESLELHTFGGGVPSPHEHHHRQRHHRRRRRRYDDSSSSENSWIRPLVDDDDIRSVSSESSYASSITHRTPTHHHSSTRQQRWALTLVNRISRSAIQRKVYRSFSRWRFVIRFHVFDCVIDELLRQHNQASRAARFNSAVIELTSSRKPKEKVREAFRVWKYSSMSVTMSSHMQRLSKSVEHSSKNMQRVDALGRRCEQVTKERDALAFEVVELQEKLVKLHEQNEKLKRRLIGKR